MTKLIFIADVGLLENVFTVFSLAVYAFRVLNAMQVYDFIQIIGARMPMAKIRYFF